jgi:hypothetical protein
MSLGARKELGILSRPTCVKGAPFEYNSLPKLNTKITKPTEKLKYTGMRALQ